MARPLRIEYSAAFYHITSRGNERKDIFRDRKDKEKFLSYLESATERYGAGIHVYCLMGNHYHLLLETPLGNLSQIMRHINGAYTTYFNFRHRRSGHLFQGRYKAILVDVNAYAQELSRYIHLNPVRAGIVDKAENYPWSSYRFYIGKKKTPQWLVIDLILGFFGGRLSDARKRYREFVATLIGQKYESPLKRVVASTILGSIDFVNEIKDKHLNMKGADRNLPALRKLSQGPSIEVIKSDVESVLGDDKKLSKQVSVYFCHKYSGKKLKEIGANFGIGESAVTQSSRRLAFKLAKDSKLRRRIKIIEKKFIVNCQECRPDPSAERMRK